MVSIIILVRLSTLLYSPSLPGQLAIDRPQSPLTLQIDPSVIMSQLNGDPSTQGMHLLATLAQNRGTLQS